MRPVDIRLTNTHMRLSLRQNGTLSQSRIVGQSVHLVLCGDKFSLGGPASLLTWRDVSFDWTVVVFVKDDRCKPSYSQCYSPSHRFVSSASSHEWSKLTHQVLEVRHLPRSQCFASDVGRSPRWPRLFDQVAFTSSSTTPQPQPPPHIPDSWHRQSDQRRTTYHATRDGMETAGRRAGGRR